MILDTHNFMEQYLNLFFILLVQFNIFVDFNEQVLI